MLRSVGLRSPLPKLRLRLGTRRATSTRVIRFTARLFLLALAFVLASCASKDRDHLVRISVPDQKMLVFSKGVEVARYDVSTSKFGVGGHAGSYTTPLGEMEVAKKIGDGARPGMKFHGRRATGEIVQPNSPGRDPIVSRILWLKGLEPQNRDVFARCIYIHGTAEEWRIGTPASYGCIRMRSHDVIQLFQTLGVGARVQVSMSPFPSQIVQTALPLVPAPTTAPPSVTTRMTAPAPTPAPSVNSGETVYLKRG